MSQNNDSRPGPRPISYETIIEGSREKKPSLRDVLITSSALITMPILPHPKILGEWMREGDLGYLFAPRGHGKTWLAMLIGNAIAACVPLGQWYPGALPRRVVYFDSEMNLPDVQDRAKLIGISSPNFNWLQNELVFDHLRRGLNIAEVSDQVAIAEMLNDGDGPRIFFR